MLDFPLQNSERSARARQDAATLQVPLVVQQQMYNKSRCSVPIFLHGMQRQKTAQMRYNCSPKSHPPFVCAVAFAMYNSTLQHAYRFYRSSSQRHAHTQHSTRAHRTNTCNHHTSARLSPKTQCFQNRSQQVLASAMLDWGTHTQTQHTNAEPANGAEFCSHVL